MDPNATENASIETIQRPLFYHEKNRVRLPQVISLDPDRVWIEKQKTGWVVKKITTKKEVNRLDLLKKHLASKPKLKIAGKRFTICVPNLVSWDSSSKVMTQEFCFGSNLETELRSAKFANRVCLVTLIRLLFRWFAATGTFYEGFAPRHVIINVEQRQITILDFERETMLKKEPFHHDEFNVLVRSHVHEEFCGFLLPNEQEEIFGNIWIPVRTGKIPLNLISSRRVQLLLYELFRIASEAEVPIHYVDAALQFLSRAVTPWQENGTIFFPMLELDKARGPENYIRNAIALNNIRTT